jgi:prepilin-type processing-associated H-X9-DG protein
MYASDHDGRYPVGWQHGTSVAPADSTCVTEANTAFRELLGTGIVKDERIFYRRADKPLAWYRKLFAPAPRFLVGDNNLGKSPDFDNALAAGENAYVYFSGLSESSGSGEALSCEPVAKDGAICQSADGLCWEAKGLEQWIHGGNGLNVLFCDGSVAYVQKNTADGVVRFGTNSAAAVVKLPLER